LFYFSNSYWAIGFLFSTILPAYSLADPPVLAFLVRPAWSRICILSFVLGDGAALAAGWEPLAEVFFSV
jgi:hypothetical protein